MLFSSFFVAILVSIGRMHDQSIDIPMETSQKTFNTSGAETFCRYLLHGLHFGICEAGSW